MGNIDSMKPEEFKGFKVWFKVMWSNFFIQIFVIALTFLCIGFVGLDGWNLLVLLIPFAAMSAVAYKAFYQFWNDLKSGNSR